jgi:hypothetical protein
MEIGSLNQFIKKAIEYYDNQKLKYNNLISISQVKTDNEMNTIKFIDNNKQDEYMFETLGYFDNNTNIWIWGWLMHQLKSNQTRICRDLLAYGLKLEPDTILEEHNFIKSLLVNSRIMVDEFTQLETNLAICSYLVRDKFKFIYPYKLYLDNTKEKYITFYYLIK